MLPEENYQENRNIIMTTDDHVVEAMAKDFAYDATAKQRVLVVVEDDYSIEKYTQVYQPFNEALAEYDRLREVNLSGEGNDQELETASDTADNFFFEENCIDVEGIEGAKPENWKEVIDLDERQAGIRRLLAVKVRKDADVPKVARKRSFEVVKTTNNRINLLSTFNGQEVETAIIFANKLPSDISKYNRLKARIGLKESKGFDDSTKIKIPAQMAAKAELARNLGRTNEKDANYKGYTSEGYKDGIVPMHHLALALTAYFERSIKTNQKK